MNNNLKRIEKELRAFAKRCKDLKYNTALLFSFLVTGSLSLSANGKDDVETAKRGLQTSITDMKKLFKEAKIENNKLMRASNLELVQLMEQGDHVVKSPWSSWQYGMNGFYNNWRGTYNGHGDKTGSVIFQRSSDLSKYSYQTEGVSKYGTTSITLGNALEKLVEIEVDASLRTLSIDKQAPTFVPATPSGGLPPFEPRVIAAPNLPQPPDNPNIKVFDPPSLNFQAQGYGQGSSTEFATNVGYMGVANNFISYDTGTDTLDINVVGGVPTWSGATLSAVTPAGVTQTLSPGTVSSGQINSFFNDVQTNSVIHKGNYKITMNDQPSNYNMIIFSSINPYGGSNHTYEFTGNLSLNGHDNPSSNNVLIGFEQQLLSYAFTLKNSGNINLDSGNNVIGIQIDSEGSHPAGNVVDNSGGKININSQNSIGIDFGYYYATPLNTNIKIGNINVNGSSNYGLRMRSYSVSTYYDNVGVSGGMINVKGTKNVGFSIAQGTSTGDPLSKVTGLNILVGGTGNVGFLRNSQGSYTNNTAMNLDTTKMSSIAFDSDATESALIRSDKDEIKLDQDITVGTIGVKNTLLQAGKQGTVRLGSGKTITSTSSDEFYGMTAGSFPTTGTGTTGAKIINDGTLTIGGNKSIAMAVDTGNTGEQNGTITYTGNNASAIFNKGTFTAGAASTTTISGDGNIGIYNKGTMTLNGAVGMTLAKGSTGIFSDGGTITSTPNKVTISVDDTTTPTGTEKGVAIYATNGANVTLQGANLTIKSGASGVVSEGAGTSLDLTSSTIDYEGDGYGVYNANSGTVDLSGATLTLRGKSVGFQKDFSVPGSITTDSLTKINVFSDDVTVMNLKNATTPLNLTNLDTNLATLAGLAPGSIHNTDPSGTTYNNYKLASIDGLNTYEIDKDLDKSLAVTGADADVTTFVKKLIVQRAIVNLQAGKNVTAHLSSSDLTATGMKGVVGLDMSSSSSAVSNNETQINLAAGSSVSADRTDAGSGAVGLFINYGKVNTDASSTINVEQLTTNPHNDSAVGIYAVNGSEVNNEGTVNVGGNSSIGLLGLAYREDATTGAPKVNEFGGKPGEGTTSIVNKGNVTLDGTTSYGIYVKNNNSAGTKAGAIGTNTGNGVLTLSGDKSIGMIGDKATLTNDINAKINMTGQEQVGMFANNSSSLINRGEINLAATTGSVPSVGIYTNDAATDIVNDGKITGGNKNYGIFGTTVTHGATGEITVGDEGVGIYSTEGNVTLNAGSKVRVGANEGVGVFTTGTAGRTISSDTDMTVGDSSFGYVIKNTGTTTLTTNGTVTLGNEAKYIYSNNSDITVNNNVALTSTGNNTYGIYSPGTVVNNANIDFGRGTGSVAIYAINGGNATNNAVISVSGSNLSATPVPEYGMGMATSNGTITNNGTIKVALDEGIGMFASGSGSRAINSSTGVIELSGKNTKGMYVDNNAVGENWGIIKTVPTPNNDGILGVVATGGGVIKNYGQIIVDGPNNRAGYLGSTGTFTNETSGGITGTVTNTGGAEGVVRKTGSPTGKTVAGIEIIAPAGATSATIKINGSTVVPTYVDTNARTSTPSTVSVTSPSGVTSIIDLGTTGLGSISTNEKVGSLGMYIDTSGVNYTHPIVGVNNLTGLQKINLIFGSEAARYTDSKTIEVGNNIIDPYNTMISNMAAAGTGTKFTLGAGSLTWFATATQNLSTGTLGKVYLVKIPYTAFAQDTNTYNFLNGLEQRYGVEAAGREKDLFNKLNDLGKGESHILAQAIDEMKGHQYANIQQRVNATGNTLDQEFNYLQNNWRNTTKNSNKIKVFGMRNEYNTDTAGIYDYTSNAVGVAYVHENEGIKLGHKSGWYAGAVNNRFRFKDIGKSRENQTMVKAGIFKTMSPVTDHNGSLQWTVAGDAFISRNEMKRKFWIVDEIFDAKSDYSSYGVAFKTNLGYDIRLSERTHLRPYGGLKLEYGRFNDIKEDNGQIRLEVEGNDYFSVKPEVGIEFKYVQPLAVKTQLSVGLSAAYENELGKVNNTNKARVRFTSADWYDLRSEKEDRRGSGKFDLNIGVDNTRFGVTVNAGYDTKGHNVRGGLGFRAIY